MTRPTTRVLAVLELLQSRGRVSGPELAQRIGVDGRTLRRYIAMLEELGIPIVAERGRFGGYALIAGFKLPPLVFTNDEALALGVGLLAARSLGLADAAPAVAGAQSKLQRVMPQALKRRLREGLTGLVGVRVLSPPAPEGAPIVTLVADALEKVGPEGAITVEGTARRAVAIQARALADGTGAAGMSPVIPLVGLLAAAPEIRRSAAATSRPVIGSRPIRWQSPCDSSRTTAWPSMPM